MRKKMFHVRQGKSAPTLSDPHHSGIGRHGLALKKSNLFNPGCFFLRTNQRERSHKSV